MPATLAVLEGKIYLCRGEETFAWQSGMGEMAAVKHTGAMEPSLLTDEAGALYVLDRFSGVLYTADVSGGVFQYGKEQQLAWDALVSIEGGTMLRGD